MISNKLHQNTDFPVGTSVTGLLGWQRYVVTNGKSVPLRKVPAGISLQNALNILGLTGLTAYFGMLDIGNPQAGETVLVLARVLARQLDLPLHRKALVRTRYTSQQI